MEKIHDFAKREYSRHYFRVGNCLCFPSARNVVGNLRAHDPHQNCAVLLGAGQSNQQQVSRRRVATIRSVGVVYVRLSACVCRSVCVLCARLRPGSESPGASADACAMALPAPLPVGGGAGWTVVGDPGAKDLPGVGSSVRTISICQPFRGALCKCWSRNQWKVSS